MNSNAITGITAGTVFMVQKMAKGDDNTQIR
jgi:hypothetical protein